MSRTRKRGKTQHTILKISAHGGEANVYLAFPPELVVTMQEREAQQPPGETWKCYELQLAIGTGKKKQSLPGLQLLYRENPNPATDGSYEERLRAYYKARGIPPIFADLSYSAYIREQDRGQS
jgi:hypothetical protein